MASAPSVTQWTQLVATQLPPLSRPQATVLALWGLGLVLARSGGRTAGSVFVASRQDRRENTVRQQLREWCYEALAGFRHGLQAPPAGRHLVGLLGTGAGGAVVAGDRSAPRGQHDGLVWLAGLDRARLQADQTGRLAVAAPAHDRPGAGGPLVAGERGGGRKTRSSAAPCSM